MKSSQPDNETLWYSVKNRFYFSRKAPLILKHLVHRFSNFSIPSRKWKFGKLLKYLSTALQLLHWMRSAFQRKLFQVWEKMEVWVCQIRKIGGMAENIVSRCIWSDSVNATNTLPIISRTFTRLSPSRCPHDIEVYPF